MHQGRNEGGRKRRGKEFINTLNLLHRRRSALSQRFVFAWNTKRRKKWYTHEICRVVAITFHVNSSLLLLLSSPTDNVRQHYMARNMAQLSQFLIDELFLSLLPPTKDFHRYWLRTNKWTSVGVHRPGIDGGFPFGVSMLLILYFFILIILYVS